MLLTEHALGEICREDWCRRTDVHAPHPMTPKDRARWRAEIRADRHARTLQTPPWRRLAGRALDNLIARAVSAVVPTYARAITEAVVAEYGPVDQRTIQRRLIKLVARGHLLRLDTGDGLVVYLRPGSKLAAEPALLGDQVRDLIMAQQEAQRAHAEAP